MRRARRSAPAAETGAGMIGTAILRYARRALFRHAGGTG
jgi:hypothetical protein